MHASKPLSVVTGAPSDIGPELVKLFEHSVFDLVLAAEDDAISSAAEPIREPGEDVDGVRVDGSAATASRSSPNGSPKPHGRWRPSRSTRGSG